MRIKFIKLIILATAIFINACQGSSQDIEKILIENGDYAITNVSVVSMLNDQIAANQTVIVSEGKILSIRNSNEVELSESIEIIEGSGKYLIPGLAEMHAHIPGKSSDLGEDYLENTLFLYLANGVTTIRGMLGQPYHLELRELANKNEILSPRIFTSGPSINGNSVQTIEKAQKEVRAQKAAGYDFLKLHPGLKLEVFNEIDKVADEVGIPFSGHVAVDVGVRRALEARYASIDHVDGYLEGLVPESANVNPSDNGFFGLNFTDLADESIIAELAQSTKSQHVWIVPTQSLMDRWITSIPPEELASEPAMRYIPESLLERYVNSKKQILDNEDYDAEMVDRFIVLRQKIIKGLSDAGVGMLLGSDAPQVFNVPGFSIQNELRSMILAGLTPYEALLSGTANPAIFFNKEGLFGVIKEDADADMVLLNGNPLEDIGYVGDNAGVMVRGKWLSKKEIQERLGKIAKRYQGDE